MIKVKILESKTQKEVNAQITKAIFKELPKKKDGWQFNWRNLSTVEGGQIYKLTLTNKISCIEGVMMLTLMNDEMLYMNTYGSNGKYENIAGCLIAFGCLLSFELGKDSYNGYLTFESKTELIELYHRKYGALLAVGQRMFFTPETGLKLIEKYLHQKL